MMQLGEKVGGEAGVGEVKQQQQQQQQQQKDGGSNSKQLKRSLNAGDQLVPGALPKPTTPLPCPRCESLNTKFCYYNNYSVTQPRHFCRQCQRYWTAGGTLRNVPVGGGSRKKSRHSQRAPDQQQQHHPPAVVPPAYMTPFMQPQMSMGGMMGFQHLMQQQQQQQQQQQPPVVAPDMTGFSFGGYGVAPAPPPPDMVAMPLQMRPGGEDSPKLLNLQPELVEINNNNLHVDHVVGVKITKNGSSSSTIEEEGSTPTNGYSNSGYNEPAECDAVSSMWHEMHDMDNVLFQ